MDILARHVVAPHVMPGREEIASVTHEPKGFADWDRRIDSCRRNNVDESEEKFLETTEILK